MLLDEEGRRHRGCHWLQMTLLLPTKETTPWQKLYASGHNPSLKRGGKGSHLRCHEYVWIHVSSLTRVLEVNIIAQNVRKCE
jgi:hypothetical protein